ncbi:MAG: transglycosylase SLT domain-containing protein [Desulfobacterales bacterium]|nr:transglycosylase SLT domain-containing protein [Desulfobacterales bacterium]MDP6683797.1 transglycosylase SLT domain-containing protein [Desulfobacterales bacterium]MDP6806186.1 transglycosylase SLT domain-containing protein [Desulfobacterales bacterium]
MAIIESALRPHMRSRKGAVGFWQFMASTGREYGLKINRHIDERRNFFASSRAAIRYFKKLHESFGSWVLAVSAFNMGEKRLKAEIIEQGTADFFQLYLPLETQRFLFRIISVKLIFSDPFRYGFKLDKADYYHQLSFDRIKMKSVDQIPIRIIAQAAETQFKVIKDLNPEIRGHYLVSGNHDILIPKGASEGFHKRFQALFENYLTVSKKRVYIVKKGDNLSLIANRFNIPLATLLIWNRLDFRRPIHPGDRLIIYPVKKKQKN